MQKVTENVFIGENIRGCNVNVVVTSAGLVLIDTPMVPDEAKAFRKELEKLGGIKYVITNEPHRDHVAGGCWLGLMCILYCGSQQVSFMPRGSRQMCFSLIRNRDVKNPGPIKCGFMTYAPICTLR